MKKLCCLVVVVLVLSMTVNVFALSKKTNTEQYVPHSSSKGYGVRDVELPNPLLRITYGDWSESVGGTGGGTWYWGISQDDWVYSKLRCVSYESRTSVKAGLLTSWKTSGWSAKNVTAVVSAFASQLGGNKAAYDYK